MPIYKLRTSVRFRDGALKAFTDKAISQIATAIKREEKYVAVVIVDNVTGLKKEGSDHSARCDVVYFEDFNKDILASGGLRLKSLLEKSFGEVTFGIKYFNYKDKTVLIDWRERDGVFASVSMGNQGPKRNCWAYIAAYIAGFTYSLEHPGVTDTKEVVCSVQDLSDWVYSFCDFNTDIDKYGTYGGNGEHAFQYIKKMGVSFLQNYPTAMLEERDENVILKSFDDKKFREMIATSGDRIFISSYKCFYPDTSENVFSIELATSILHQGIAYGSVKCCIHGCEYCPGFDEFNGEGTYDEPPHLEGYKCRSHAVAVVGAGHRNGKDYLTVLNTRGSTFAANGYADMNIKFFNQLIQVSGTMRKTYIESGGKLLNYTVAT